MMAIDINISVTAGFFHKWMTVGRMREALSGLEDDDLIYPNRVGNLTVCRGKDYIGYIDFNSEIYESWDEI